MTPSLLEESLFREPEDITLYKYKSKLLITAFHFSQLLNS